MLANILFGISVFCSGIQFGICAHQLELRESIPQFQHRRSMNIQPIEKPPNSHYNKIKVRPKVENKSSTMELKKNNTNTTTAADDDKQVLRMRKDASNNAWFRFQKTLKTKLIARSTRMTPKHASLQEATHTKKISDENKVAFVLSTDEPIQLLEDNDKAEIILNPYDIKNQLEQIMSEYPAANTSVEVIGRTVEYNNIIMIKVAESNIESNKYFRADDSKYIDEVPEKKIIFIVHGLSVKGIKVLPCLRELDQFKKLLEFYFAHLDKFDIFLIPMANPDGYSSHFLTWDKNMSPQSACPGVALDRNFDVAWNGSMAMSSCNQQYPGAKPFSEAETKAIRDIFQRYSHKIVGYFHVHAGTYDYESFKGDAVLYPKGYSDTQTDDDKYIDLRGEIDEAMKNASFQVISVSVDTLYSWYDKVLGTSVDYASTVYGIPYAMELVMQPYKDDEFNDERLSQIALSEIWKRIIDVIFNNIHRNLKPNEV